MNEQNQGLQLLNQDQDDQKKKDAKTAALQQIGSGGVYSQQKPAGGPMGAAAGAVGPSSSAAARAQQAAGGARGSGFTGIGRYLGANVGSRLGQTISGGISAVGQQAKSQLGQAVGKFRGQLSESQQKLGQAQTGFQQGISGILSGASPYIEEQKPGVSTAPVGAGGIVGATRAYTTAPVAEPKPAVEPAVKPDLTQPVSTKGRAISQPIKDFEAPPEEAAPSEVAPPTQQVEPSKPTEAPKPAESSMDAAAAYKALTEGQITTPRGLEDTEAARQRASRAAQMAEATRTAGGRSALLQEQFGRGGRLYTRGQTALDALLLGRASKELAGARKEAAGVQRQLRSEEKTAQEQSKELQSRALAAAEEAKSAVGGAEQKLGTEVRGQKEQYEKELNRLSTNLTQEIESGLLSRESADILTNLGLDPTSSQLYNLNKSDLAKMIKSRGLADVTEASSGKLEQLQKINALRKLAGQESKFTAEQLAQAGQTAGKEAAITGIGTEGELSETIKKGREEYEKLLSQVIPGYKGFGEVLPYAKEFRTEGDVNAAIEGAWGQDIKAQKAGAAISSLEQQIKNQEKALESMAASSGRNWFGQSVDPKTTPAYKSQQENIDKLKSQLEDQKKSFAEANAKIDKYKRAFGYLNMLGAFEYSPGRGQIRKNVDLASKLYSGELFDPVTGELNVDLAKQAESFFGWRPKYMGKGGFLGTGAGQYGRYEGDVARQQALQKLIAGAGQRFKIKGEEK